MRHFLDHCRAAGPYNHCNLMHVNVVNVDVLYCHSNSVHMSNFYFNFKVWALSLYFQLKVLKQQWTVTIQITTCFCSLALPDFRQTCKYFIHNVTKATQLCAALLWRLTKLL